MKTISTLLSAAALSISLFTATGANAALTSALGGQVVNDTDRNIVWLANANLADTNSFGVSGINANGTMSWFTAQNWIGAMNTANYLGYNDWRLPTTLQPDPSCSLQLNAGHLLATKALVTARAARWATCFTTNWVVRLAVQS